MNFYSFHLKIATNVIWNLLLVMCLLALPGGQHLRKNLCNSQSVQPYSDVDTHSNNDAEIKSEENDNEWANINDQVDLGIPLIIEHLKKLNVSDWELPNIRESFSLNFFLSVRVADLYLTNGIVYNIEGIERYGNAFMTYKNQSLISQFNIIVKKLQLEYDFLVNLVATKASGKISGYMDNTVIFAELDINLSNLNLKLNDFRVVNLGNIYVQLEHHSLIQQLSGLILTPITNLLRDNIPKIISNSLKDQVQEALNEFNKDDGLALKQFVKEILASLLRQQVK